jgi:hypothetical protein
MVALITDGAELTPAQEQNSWPYKAVLALRGNQTLAGAILLQLIMKPPKNPPSVDSLATVDENGFTWAVCTTRSGQRGLAMVGHITDIRDEFRRLADHLKLDDGERVELFDELRKWVSIDLRADHDEMKRLH